MTIARRWQGADDARQAAVKQQLAADGRAWDSNCPLPGISIENVPQFEYNSVYLPAGEANGWPRFVSAEGMHLFHHASDPEWCLLDKFRPDTYASGTPSVAYCDAEDGRLPEGECDWKCRMEGGWHDQSVTLRLLMTDKEVEEQTKRLWSLMAQRKEAARDLKKKQRAEAEEAEKELRRRQRAAARAKQKAEAEAKAKAEKERKAAEALKTVVPSWMTDKLAGRTKHTAFPTADDTRPATPKNAIKDDALQAVHSEFLKEKEAMQTRLAALMEKSKSAPASAPEVEDDVEVAADDAHGDGMAVLAEEVEDDVDAVPPSPEPADLAEEVEDEFVVPEDTQANRMGPGGRERSVKPSFCPVPALADILDAALPP